jgi:chaperonin GroES
VLPDSAKPKYNQYKVVATGQGVRNRDGAFAPLSVKVGDTVMIGESYGGQELSFDNETFHLYREDEVLGKLN